MNNVTKAAPLLSEMEAIGQYLAAVQETVKTGFMPSIAGLEQRVTNVCLAIQQADKDVQKECLPELTALLEKLNACESDMRAWNEARTTGTDAGNANGNA